MRKNISTGFCSSIQQTQQRAKIERSQEKEAAFKVHFYLVSQQNCTLKKITPKTFPFIWVVLWSKSFCTLKVLWYYKTCQDFKWVETANCLCKIRMMTILSSWSTKVVTKKEFSKIAGQQPKWGFTLHKAHKSLSRFFTQHRMDLTS